MLDRSDSTLVGVRPERPRPADTVIRCATAYSMAASHAIYQAVAVRDDQIVAVSPDRHGLDALIEADTHVVDDPGFTLLPAFNDTHSHLVFAARAVDDVPVDRARTLAEFIALIRQRAAVTPKSPMAPAGATPAHEKGARRQDRVRRVC
jgi:predicted amidohydrolase YtcJ